MTISSAWGCIYLNKYTCNLPYLNYNVTVQMMRCINAIKGKKKKKLHASCAPILMYHIHIISSRVDECDYENK